MAMAMEGSGLDGAGMKMRMEGSGLDGAGMKMRMRALRSDDRDEIKELHRKLFPVDYPDGFFEAATTGGEGIVSVCATQHETEPCVEGTEVRGRDEHGGGRVGETTRGAETGSGRGERIIGFITAKSVAPAQGDPLWGILPKRRIGMMQALHGLFGGTTRKPQRSRGDDDGGCGTMVHENTESTVQPCTYASMEGDGDGMDLESCGRRENGNACDADRDTRVLYIMTLGVSEDFRRRGVAADLVHSLLMWHGYDSHCCVCLHVIHYNTLAQRFYRKLGFRRVKVIDEFYTLEEDREPVKVRACSRCEQLPPRHSTNRRARIHPSSRRARVVNCISLSLSLSL